MVSQNTNVITNTCSGCGACVQKCPFQAISLKLDSYGNEYAQIDSEKCKNCHLCKKICPECAEVNLLYPESCYAAVTKNELDYDTTSSGGLATVFALKFIESNNVVYGAAFDNIRVSHIRAENEEQVERIKGSKYVKSDTVDSFSQIKKDLESGKQVLFIGTPCQVAGVRSFFKDMSTDNLFLVDLICHGTPPIKYLQEYISNICDASKVTNVIFRKKNWRLSITAAEKTIYSRISVDDQYCAAFAAALSFRENCYSCRYARPERCGDITIGDFWGLGDDCKLQQKSKSVVLINTNRGRELWGSIADRVYSEERSVIEAVQGNSQLRSPSIRPKEREKFLALYPQKGFVSSLKRFPLWWITEFRHLKHSNKGGGVWTDDNSRD